MRVVILVMKQGGKSHNPQENESSIELQNSPKLHITNMHTAELTDKVSY